MRKGSGIGAARSARDNQPQVAVEKKKWNQMKGTGPLLGRTSHFPRACSYLWLVAVKMRSANRNLPSCRSSYWQRQGAI